MVGEKMNKRLLALIIALAVIVVASLGLYINSQNGNENDFDLSGDAYTFWDNNTKIFNFEKSIPVISGNDYKDVLVQMDLYKNSELIASLIQMNDTNKGTLTVCGNIELDEEPDNYTFKIIDNIPDDVDEAILLSNVGGIEPKELFKDIFDSSSEIHANWDSQSNELTFNKEFKSLNTHDFKDVIVQVDIYKGSELLKSVNITNDTHDLILEINGSDYYEL